MTGNDLILAIGDIDSKYIAEADAICGTEQRVAKHAVQNANNKQHGKRNVAKLWGVAATACCLIRALVIGLVLPMRVSDRKSGSAGDEGSRPQVGMLHTTMRNSFGSVTFSDMTECSITLDIQISDFNEYISWDITLRAKIHNGEEVTACYFSTDPDLQLNGAVRLDDMTVTINGVVSENNSMPKDEGNYNVVIDISESVEQYSAVEMVDFQVCKLLFMCKE